MSRPIPAPRRTHVPPVPRRTITEDDLDRWLAGGPLHATGEYEKKAA